MVNIVDMIVMNMKVFEMILVVTSIYLLLVAAVATMVLSMARGVSPAIGRLVLVGDPIQSMRGTWTSMPFM